MRSRGRALPGAREALAAFAELPHITQTVLTGNPKPSSIVKLETFDLAHWLDLDIGAYGTDDSIRPNLVPIAQARAATSTGHTYTRESTYIIGDTISDIEAAQEGGAQVVAVATGNTTSAELRNAGASIVLLSLSAIDSLQHAVAAQSRGRN
jgi:phosphoglycolate phosphatase-like HAD superfamily hydrolase